MKKILFLTDMWSPQPTANSICVNNIASVLKKRGWDVYVNAFKTNNYQTKETIDGINVEYTDPSISRKFLIKSTIVSNKRKKKFFENIGIILNRITRLLCIACYPIASPLFAIRWYKKALKQIVDNDIEYLVSVNAPLDSIATGYFIKKKYPNIKWIAYYIDSGSNYGKEQNFLWLKKRLQKKSMDWENKVLNIADKIIVMEGHSNFYMNNLNEGNLLKLDVLNVPLFDFNNIVEDNVVRNNHQKEIWTYTGTIARKIYNPTKLLSWFSKYAENHNAELHLYGSTNIEDFLLENCDDKTFFYHGLVPHSNISDILKESDVLIYFTSENLDSVSGKFFEYLMYKKPIVYMGVKDDINFKQIKKYPLGLAIDQDTYYQTKKIDEVINIDTDVSNNFLKKIFYTSTPDSFVDVLEKL